MISPGHRNATDVFALDPPVNHATLQYSIKLEASILVHGGEGVQVQMPVAIGTGTFRLRERLACADGAIRKLDRLAHGRICARW